MKGEREASGHPGRRGGVFSGTRPVLLTHDTRCANLIGGGGAAAISWLKLPTTRGIQDFMRMQDFLNLPPPPAKFEPRTPSPSRARPCLEPVWAATCCWLPTRSAASHQIRSKRRARPKRPERWVGIPPKELAILPNLPPVVVSCHCANFWHLFRGLSSVGSAGLPGVDASPSPCQGFLAKLI